MKTSRRERLLTVLRGGVSDCVPWTIYEWLLPETRAAQLCQEQGLALIGAAGLCREIRPEVTVETETVNGSEGVETHTRIRTPVGDLFEKAINDPSYGSRWIKEHLIKSIEDYATMEFVYRNTTYEPDYEAYRRADTEMAQAGIVLGCIKPIPVQELLVEAMGTEAWCEGVLLHTDAFEQLLAAVTATYIRQVELAAAGPAEVIWFPDNVTGQVMSPDLFTRYCKPVYDHACGVMRQAGKIPFAHYDGANRPLRQCLASVDLPVLEALTPPPMGDMTVTEARQAWPDKVVSINFPGNLFLADESTIEKHARTYLEEGGREGKFVLGCTEDYPADHGEKTFRAIGRAMSR